MEDLTHLEKALMMVEECKKYAEEHDDEMAHVAEKQAWQQALLAVRNREKGYQEAVEAALSTRDISFARFYA